MSSDSTIAQVVTLSRKRPVTDIPVPGAGEPMLRDVHPERPFDAAAIGFVLSALPDTGAPILWVQDRPSSRENGRLYGPAVRQFGVMAPVLRVEVSHPRDVLWAMEEGAGCAGLAAVVGEIHGAPEVLSFTATKRLALRSEASGVPVWLIRSGDPGALSAARERWRVGSSPAAPHPYNSQAPGKPLWAAELFRARGRAPGHWVAYHERACGDGGADRQGIADRLRLVSRSGDGAVAADGHAATHAARG